MDSWISNFQCLNMFVFVFVENDHSTINIYVWHSQINKAIFQNDPFPNAPVTLIKYWWPDFTIINNIFFCFTKYYNVEIIYDLALCRCLRELSGHISGPFMVLIHHFNSFPDISLIWSWPIIISFFMFSSYSYLSQSS